MQGRLGTPYDVPYKNQCADYLVMCSSPLTRVFILRMIILCERVAFGLHCSSSSMSRAHLKLPTPHTMRARTYGMPK